MIVPNRRPYDVAMEHDGKLIKLQVKSSTYRTTKRKTITQDIPLVLIEEVE